MEKIIEFKEPILRGEFENTIDSRLKVILYALAGYVFYAFGKVLTITELVRTQGMQDLYYKDNPEYQIKKFMSPHQFGRAADVSIKYFTEDEVAKIDKFINGNFHYSSARYKTGLVHDIGLENHLHVQVDSDDVMEIVKE